MDLSKRAEQVNREVRHYGITDVEVRRDTEDGNVTFRGVATAFDKPYTVHDAFGEFEETVRSGAADKTLSENPDVVFLVNHTGVTMARTTAGTLELNAKKDGLHVRADLDPTRSDVEIVTKALERGDINEMSFAFRVTRQEWNEDYTQRTINEFNINRGDVSAVNFGANPHTTAALRFAGCTAEDLGDAYTALLDGTCDDGQRALVERACASLTDALATPDNDWLAVAQMRLQLNANRLALQA